MEPSVLPYVLPPENGSTKEETLTIAKTGALVAALLTAAAPAALAQSHMASVPTPPKTITGTVGPNQIRASKMIGTNVYGMYNQQIGSVQDIILNRSGRVAAVVVSANGKNVALPLNDFDASRNRLTLMHISLQELKGAAPFHLTNNNTGAGKTGVPLRGGPLGTGTAVGSGAGGQLGTGAGK
jgi:sporulation protein YlmC with PRC-barrel domain